MPFALAAQPDPLPTLKELEAAGARVGVIRVVAKDIFDTTDPLEDNWLFRLANGMHIETRPSVIEHALLFKSGEPLSLQKLDESERLLRESRYLYSVEFRPAAYHDGVVDIDVVTRDTWSLDAGVSLGRAGGVNTGGFSLREYNLLGSGMALSLGHTKGVDRSGNEFSLGTDHAFGSRVAFNLAHATNSDGRRDAFTVRQPFYALDSRWSAGFSVLRDDRIDPVYNTGEVESQYRHHLKEAEVFGGWSQGLVNGWTQRYSLGMGLRDNTYLPEPGMVAPSDLPDDQKLVYPFVRYELVEDRFDRELNRNLIGRPEFFAIGLNSMLQLGLATRSLGSSADALVYQWTLSRGFEPSPDQTLMAAAQTSGQYADGQLQRHQLGGQMQYYLRLRPNALFYAGASADMLTNSEIDQLLMLGGDNGLRGYPLRYQTGTRRALFTVEERFYTDWYVWRLFHVGAAVFADVGHAWGGPNTNLSNPGWLSDVGVGLRIVSARSAFGNVLHLDVASPLNTTPDIKRVQFLVKTKTSF
ncbi:MAG TPA: BamA/TamA family outer membrane protein [Rhizobacter sp.]|nr:BamA/TamA family outer membrane protein [Rhizobacter sp.]